MKIFYDARYIRTDHHDGISRYCLELGLALARQTPLTFIICDPAQRAFLPARAKTVLLHPPTSYKEPFSSRILNQYQPDVVFSPMQTLGASGRKFKLILTLHDLIYYRHRTPPRNLSLPIRVLWRIYHATFIPQRMTLNAADVVATVSETSRREIERARLTKRPIVVVPNAPQQFSRDDVRHRGAVKNIVYMGSFMRYKNVELLIKGMRWLPGRTLHLLSRITPTRRAELEALIPKGATVVFHNGVTDEQYQALLADNAVLASASFDEGYGLPVAEALAMGVPAVITDMPIFHEVAAGGALYFDPHKPKSFADQVMRLDDKKTRDALIAAGVQQALSYSWDDSARNLLKTIHELM